MTPNTAAGNPAESTDRHPSYRRLAAKLKALPRRVAAPSCVIPDTAGANCRFLADLFPEVGLCLFETASCLAYGEDDLPADLAALPLDYHVHLPLDLPWAEGPAQAARAAVALAGRTAYLAPRAFVLHPPATAGELEAFVAVWSGAGLAPADLLLENIEGNDLAGLMEPSKGLGLSLCLDLGHMISYEHEFLARIADWERVRMLHVYAPGIGSRHAALTALDDRGQKLLRTMLERARPDAVLTLEVFGEQGLLDSAALLMQWMEEWNPE